MKPSRSLVQGLAIAGAALALAACATIAPPGPPPPGAAIPAAPLDLGDWRSASINQTLSNFERAVQSRYAQGLPLRDVASDLRAQDFRCTGVGRSEVGEPPSQLCRRTETAGDCTHTWQVHLYDSAGDGLYSRARPLYDRRCGGDGLLGGPG